ncbi:ABC transporter permease subunit [Gryllotalpicola sp.]|uniref:ABC transporter permease n=1 Tax=Gryllotalpicola sp. TaxID=1932787 RepID=UPI002604B6CA|nr:ABC transporter permease subunit [Gryllotalpicola sp.]
MSRGRAFPRWAATIAGIAVILLIWWLASFIHYDQANGTAFHPVPAPWDVVDWLVIQGALPGYWPSLQPTLIEAGLGFLWGNGIALLLCALVLLVPWLETVITQIAVVSYCLPIVAVGSLAIILIGGAKNPGDPSQTGILLAALVLFFTTVSGTLLGFKSADAASVDVVRVFGGGRWSQLVKVRLVAALPAILSALQVAVPTSFLGAVLGEYMGHIDRSVGTLLIFYQSQNDSIGMWSLFLLCALVSVVGYGIVGLIARLITPWVRGRAAG